MSQEIPGARRRLAEETERLRGYLKELAARLTPGQVPEFPLEYAPFVDHGTVPATFHQSLSGVVRPQGVSAVEAVARAAELFAADGWRTAGPAPGDRNTVLESVVTGTLDGMEIRVSAARGTGVLAYRGRTKPVALYPERPHVRPEPVRTAETVSAGDLCYECDGLGWCPCCEGRGWVMGGSAGWGGGGRRDPDRLGRCPLCGTRRVCPVCNGSGQLFPYR
ncbi:hypothetical protein [Streptomyces bambusae]|uniref:Uncharacterized protein n=1 Tax=Streptomyces bambusae TaxID=1550616 RepID=A0ABS6ZCS1_9ACTN|nr:hypothetical protein [Streptomyces bambusae]MBW5485028.1 hypothetical protein [Streptomyces bambusae]